MGINGRVQHYNAFSWNILTHITVLACVGFLAQPGQLDAL